MPDELDTNQNPEQSPVESTTNADKIQEISEFYQDKKTMNEAAAEPIIDRSPKWWRIVLIIIFHPFVILYLVWKKTNWNKWVKITITATFVIIVIISFGAEPNQEDKKPLNSVDQNVLNTEKQESNVKAPDQQPEVKKEETPEENKEKPRDTQTQQEIARQETPKVEPPKQEAPNETVSQRSAIRTAENYLKIKGFSRTGLIDQLKFEEFSEEDAVYAVDNISIDYNEQAKKSAESYMDIKGFSREGLIDQLKFEGFTQAQAEYGVKSVGL